MSHLEYFTYPHHGVTLQGLWHYNQAVRVGDRIECSGQCGWDTKTGEVPSDTEQEIINCFKNVDLALRTAGGQGWSQVFKVRLFTTTLDEESMNIFVKHFKDWTPDHMPILTGVQVAALASPDMHFEVEVHAHVP